MNTNFSDQNQILGYPKYASSHNIDLSKIVTLSALVEPDSNLSKLKEKIERLKFQIAGQQQEIFLLKKSKLRFSNSVALNEEVQLVKKINSDLRAKVLELSKATRDYETKLQISLNETSQIEDKLRTVLQENIELKLQIHNNRNDEKSSKASLLEKDTISLASEIRDLKKQVSLMRDHFEKSMISLVPNSRSSVPNNSSIPKWSIPKSTDGIWTKSSPQISKSQVFEKLNNPIVRPKKICGRLINNHLNKEISKTICITSKGKLKTNKTVASLSKKSDDSSIKSDSSDDTSDSSSSASNQSNLSENQSENIDSNSSFHSNNNYSPDGISTDNISKDIAEIANAVENNYISDSKASEIQIKLQLINETKSELDEQIDEKLQQTTLLDISCVCKVQNMFEKISDNEVD